MTGQEITFCGVNAHFQNGIAERSTCTIVDQATAMLLHAIKKWPDEITIDLWPSFTLRLFVDIYNSTPSKSGLSPEEIFMGQKRKNKLELFHMFGHPIFVLEPRFQQGQKILKWEPRSHMGIYLGNSPFHTQTVPLILNLWSGLVSPQYHVIYEDQFTSTTSMKTNKLPDNWKELFKEHRDNVLEGCDELQQSTN